MIFGGYILHLTFELAQICATRFAQGEARFIRLDHATFESPVPVGAMLDYEAMVVYISSSPSASKSRIQIRVKTSVRDVKSGSRTQTGTFAYTFEVERQRKALSMTYEEEVEWINAR